MHGGKKSHPIRNAGLVLFLFAFPPGAWFGVEYLAVQREQPEAADKVGLTLTVMQERFLAEPAPPEPETPPPPKPKLSKEEQEEQDTHMLMARNGMIDLRSIAAKANSETLCPEAWAAAAAERERARKLMFSQKKAEAIEAFKRAAHAFLQSQVCAEQELALRESRGAWAVALGKVEPALLAEYGGADWAALQEGLAGIDAMDRTHAAARYRETLKGLNAVVQAARVARGAAAFDRKLSDAAGAEPAEAARLLNAALRDKGKGLVEAFQAAQALDPKPVLDLPLGKGVTLPLVWVPAGSFRMGSTAAPDEQPVKAQRIARGFWMGRHEVTRAQFRALDLVVDPQPGGVELPVTRVPWALAGRFTELLSRRSGLRVRLPSEAEWEYACRAGTDTPYPHGDAPLHEFANYCDQACENPWKATGRDGFVGLAPPESFKPNAWGLYDMCGNLMEWTADPYTLSYDRGADEPALRVLRGGCWHFGPELCRASARYAYLAEYASDYVGFRVLVEGQE